MWLPKANATKKETGTGSVAVAIDKDKGSQHALKWTIDNLASRGQTISLIHVASKNSSGPKSSHIFCFSSSMIRVSMIFSMIVTESLIFCRF